MTSTTYSRHKRDNCQHGEGKIEQNKKPLNQRQTYQEFRTIFDENFVGVVYHFLGEFDHLVSKRRTEEKALALFGQYFFDEL